MPELDDDKNPIEVTMLEDEPNYEYEADLYMLSRTTDVKISDICYEYDRSSIAQPVCTSSSPKGGVLDCMHGTRTHTYLEALCNEQACPKVGWPCFCVFEYWDEQA